VHSGTPAHASVSRCIYDHQLVQQLLLMLLLITGVDQASELHATSQLMQRTVSRFLALSRDRSVSLFHRRMSAVWSRL